MFDLGLTEIRALLLVVASVLIGPAIVQLLWNRTVPDIFGLKAISYWQSFRLSLLSWMLFGIYPSINTSISKPVSEGKVVVSGL